MLIGISAPARSGKDTLADIFCAERNMRKYALAEPIKAFINALFGWDERHSDGDLKEKAVPIHITADSVQLANKVLEQYNMSKFNVSIADVVKTLGLTLYSDVTQIISPRKAYQLFGTEYGRAKISDSIWLDIAPTDGIVISDIRFENEAEWIRKNGGHIIFLHRDNRDDVADTTHASEAGVEVHEDDLHIDNNEGINDLAIRAKGLLAYIDS